MSVRIINDGPTPLVVNVWERDSPRSEGRNVERYDLPPGRSTPAIEVRSWSRGATVLEAEIPDVDRSQRTLTDGSPVTEDHRDLREDGQQRDYVVLSAEERAKGYVRPVRRTYLHVGINPTMHGPILVRAGEGGCGARTTMGMAIAETYARDPTFYSGTFCVGCGEHRPLAEFVWEGTDPPERVGS